MNQDQTKKTTGPAGGHFTDLPPEKRKATGAPKENGEKLALTAEFGTVYVKVNKGQIMRPIRATMQLFEKLGHFYGLPGKYNPDTKKREKNYAIASAGFTHLNKVASISILTPLSVIVDGHEQPNPYVERNKRTRAIESVIVRKIGIGYSPAGNITAIDKTLYYNVYTYFIQSIQAKLKKSKWSEGKETDEKANPDAGIVGIADKEPGKKGSWVFFPIEEPLGIWANYEDQAIIDCLEEHTQRQRFGDRIAQKIVERNILKDHPAIGISNVIPKVGATSEQGQMAYVEVYGYRHDMGYADLKDVMKQAARGGEDAAVEVKADVIDKVDSEEERQVVSETAGEEGKAEHETGLFNEAKK